MDQLKTSGSVANAYLGASGQTLTPELAAALGVTPTTACSWPDLPTGLAAETIWPDMEWIEALALVPEEAQTEQYEEVCAA